MSQTADLPTPPEVIESPYDLHILVCTNQKPDGRVSCGPRGADELLKRLKDWEKLTMNPSSAQSEPHSSQLRIRVNKSGCLGFCSRGIAVAAYPKGEVLIHLDGSIESAQFAIEQLEKLVQKNV